MAAAAYRAMGIQFTLPGDSDSRSVRILSTQARIQRAKRGNGAEMRRSPWIYRLGILAALLLAGGAGIKWP